MDHLYCKWLGQNMETWEDPKWEVGVPKELPVRNNLKLYEQGLFHYSPHPLIATLSVDFDDNYKKLYEVLPEGMIVEGNNICGSTKLTLVKELEIPKVTLIQKIAFRIMCAKEIYKEPTFVEWANKWLSGENRSEKLAYKAFLAYAHYGGYDNKATQVSRISLAHKAMEVQ